MSKCEDSDEYENCSDGDILYELDNKCLFHSDDNNKDTSDFIQALQKKEGSDFNGYVFPVEVEYSIFHQEVIKKGSESSTITFDKEMIFKKAHFLKGIMLAGLIFEKSINMSECKFHEECDFKESEFQGKVILDGSVVHGKMDFNKSNFLAGLSWNNAQLSEQTSKEEISFTDIKLHNSVRIDFDNIDLHRWSFLGSDISRINFKDCTWVGVSGMKECYGRSKSTSMLYDELKEKWDYKPFRNKWLHIANIDPETEKKYKEVLSLYRKLRINYESKLQYQEAGAFYIGEMEMRRLLLLQNNKRKIISDFEYFFMWLYKFLSDYGENYLKILGRFTAMVVIFAIFFMFTGLHRVHDNLNHSKKTISYSLSLQPPSVENIKEMLLNFSRSLVYSFSVATIFLKNRQYTYKNESGYYLFILESCFGAITLPLLVLAMRRNFKRSTKETIYD